MRVYLAPAACAVALALLAGCSSSSQGGSALPSSGGLGQAVPMAGHGLPYMPKGGIKPDQILRLQAAGKIPAPHGRAAALRALKELQSHPQIRVRRTAGGVGIWASQTYYNVLLGISKNGKKAVQGINTYNYEQTPDALCEEPYGVKVDANQDIWAGCYYGYNGISNSYNATGIEYNKNGNNVATYTAACPTGWGNCDYGYFYGYDGFDVAVNSTNVFVDGYFYGYDCATTDDCQYMDGAGIEYWPNGSPAATPGIIMPPYGSPFYDVYYMDVDSSGNLWVDFYGYADYEYGYGLAEITNPTTNPVVSVVEPPGTYECEGGVYVSNGGSTLNVGDSCTQHIYQYTLPLTTGAKPTKTLGPTAPFGCPEGFGFNAADSGLVAGDCDGWLDIGKVPSNKWTQAKPVIMQDGVYGAAYTPSDK